MSELMYNLFGEGKELNALQMGDRAFVMFFITLILIRITGMRAFGTKSAFDNIIVIMLGALLSRAVVGVSPFIPTVIAGLVLALVHRILAMIAIRSDAISHLIKSKEVSLYKNGKINKANMDRCNISMGDLMEGVRIEGNVTSLDEVKEVYMERNGEISVIKKSE
jgi:uncharacterized membrane protein YcaP (DUF421 family)